MKLGAAQKQVAIKMYEDHLDDGLSDRLFLSGRRGYAKLTVYANKNI